MTEFVIAIVAFIVIISGMLQIGTLCRAKVQTMIQSRSIAGMMAITDTYSPIPYPFVGNWSDGPDRISHTEDDLPVPTDFNDFMAVAERATTRPFNYPQYQPPYVMNNTLAKFIDFYGGDYSTTRGWAVGIDYRDVDIDPAFRALVYDRRSLIISSSTYLPPFNTKTIP